MGKRAVHILYRRSQNLIACMQEYQIGDLKHASKDFVDACRYFAVGNFEYFDADELIATGGGGY